MTGIRGEHDMIRYDEVPYTTSFLTQAIGSSPPSASVMHSGCVAERQARMYSYAALEKRVPWVMQVFPVWSCY